MPESASDLVQKRVRDFREQADFAEVVFDHLVGYAIIAADFDGNILAYNAGAEVIFGHRAKDAVGSMNIDALFPPQAAGAGWQALVGEMMKAGRATFEGEMQRKNGRSFTARALLTQAKGRGGKEIGFVLMVEDVTERSDWKKVIQAIKTYNDQLLELDALKTEFLSAVSHELRTPLTVILSGAENLLTGSLGSLRDGQKTWIEKIRAHSEKLRSMITDLLDLAKLESGDPFSFEDYDAGPQINAVLETMNDLLKPQGRRILTEIPSGLPKVWACRGRIEQVVRSLVANAAKFSPEGGDIRVSVRTAGGSLEVRVADDGPGIPAEHREAIFDRFRQINKKGVSLPTRGMGLGLAICRAIIERHKGRIWVEGEEGDGSTFIFSIPLDFRSLPR